MFEALRMRLSAFVLRTNENRQGNKLQAQILLLMPRSRLLLQSSTNPYNPM